MVLAKELEKSGVTATLLVRDNAIAREFLQNGKVAFFTNEPAVCHWPDADACILDIYDVQSSFIEEVQTRYRKVIAIDDGIFEHVSNVSAIINFHVYAASTDYPACKKTFLGPNYYLLRRDIKEALACSTDKSQVFVCMGGSDPENQTQRIVRILLEITSRPIDVVLGPGFEDRKELFRLEKNPNVFLHRAPKELGGLMNRARYAVTGAGSMLYELAFLKIPTACLTLAENQKKTARAFMSRKAAINLGSHDKITDEQIFASLQQFEDEQFRETLSLNAGQVIDGLGANRLADSLLDWLSG